MVIGANLGSGTSDGTRLPVCRAPFVAMEFDAFGDVQACCANALYPLGNVARSTLQEIWEGPRAQELRAALQNHDLSLGCSVCRYRLAYGHGELPLEYYNNFPAPADGLGWPFSLQFALHNTCNLACVMCGADRSSKIRSQRSHLEPLPHAYGEAFFEQIQPFLEHAGAVDFSGGEPFLIAEHGRLWDMIIELPNQPLCSLTTNGTVWNHRTERVLQELDTHISVSVDGMTKATFESIRVGADFDVVMANLERFLDYTRDRGTILTMSWSLVRGNWHELAAATRFAEERGIQLKVQTVIEPEFGLQRLPDGELAAVLRTLEAEGETFGDEIVLNRAMWDREVRRLRDELDQRAESGLRSLCMEPASDGNVGHVVDMILDGGGRVVAGADLASVTEEAHRDLRRWCGPGEVWTFEVDATGILRDRVVLDLLPTEQVCGGAGASLGDLLHSIEHQLDGRVWIGDEWDEGSRLVQTIWIGRPVRDKVGLVLKVVTISHGAGHRLMVAADRTLLPVVDGAVAVQLGSRRSVRPAQR